MAADKRRGARARHIVLATMFLVVVVVGATGASQLFRHARVVVRIAGSQEMEIVAEVADTPLARYVGLMFRGWLPPDEGMLFRYKEAGPRTFWMKNTRIPLDMVFIGPDRRVVNVVEAVPCRSEPCPRYRSRGPAQYVLEVNRGLCRTHGVGRGAVVEIQPGTRGAEHKIR